MEVQKLTKRYCKSTWEVSFAKIDFFVYINDVL